MSAGDFSFGDIGSSDTVDTSGDSTLAQLSDVFSSIGTAATTIIPAIEGPQQLASGQTYVVGGKVVTAPTQSTAGLASLGVSPTLLILLALAVIVAIMMMKK
jgi:hypothetical protein